MAITTAGKAGWWQGLSAGERATFISDNPAAPAGTPFGEGVQYATYDESGRIVHSKDPLTDPNAVPISGMGKDIMAKWDPVGTAELDAQQMRFNTWMEASGYEEGVGYGSSGNTAWQLFDQVERAGGTASTFDPFTGWVDGASAAGQSGPTMADGSGQMDFGGSNQGEEFSLGDFVAALTAIGIPNDMAQSLWTWGQEKMLDATYPVENFVVDIYEQPAFQARFPAIKEMQGRDDVRPISPKDYLAFEEDVKELLTRHSAGGQNINFDGLITSLLTNTVGTGEVEERLVAAKRVLGNVPEEVKTTYMAWYGPGVAEENLMKTFLDPEDKWGGSWADVEAEVATSEIGGWTRLRLALDDEAAGLTQQTASNIARLGLSQQNIWQRLDALKNQEKLFSEKLGEEDFTITGEGVDAAFDLDFDAQDALEQRKDTRSAEFGGGGGAMLAGATTGFGAANA
jgi:hypothetical protein|tara:strand:- start:14311 stop:15678 length:1368 start_codon:yes stop_codon:yes gene_type:complete